MPEAIAPRRAFVRALLVGTAGLPLAWALRARAQAAISVTRVNARLAILSGGGGNVGLLTGPDGVLMVDGGRADAAAGLAEAARGISDALVRVLFNTHYHFDHVGSNARLGGDRARIIAHDNVARRLSERLENEAFGMVFEPLPDEALPTETFADTGSLEFGGQTITFAHVPAAHTDGDAYVHFEGDNVVHAGDLLWTGRYPVIDYVVGGSLARMAAALDVLDGVGDADTRIIAGHGGPLVGKAEVRALREMWLTINGRLEEHARQGRSVEEVMEWAPTEDFNAIVGVDEPAQFIRQAYGGVLRQIS
jgi:glyoxylase-like metal-dependent hydrolase (beta-lactamase superfamily II)